MASIQGSSQGLRECALFAGAGGGILGGKLLGWQTVCAVEINAFCARRLMQRQNEGHLSPFPIWDDIRSFDGHPWRGLIDVVSGGFPCQGISVAGDGLGLSDPRSGLWGEQSRLVREIQPPFVFVENSPALTFRGLGVVMGDLAKMGYNAEWGVLSCEDVGGVHLRERIWIAASHPSVMLGDGGSLNAIHRIGEKVSELRNHHSSVHASDYWGERKQREQQKEIFRFSRFPWGEDVRGIEDLRKRSDLPEPIIRRISHDVANGMDRLHAIGNGQVPRVAALAWRILSGR